jgi:transglutaminase-like putative cysteine protease
MRVSIAHTTRLDYGADVVEAVMDTRLGPFSDVHQRWDVFELRAAPSAAVRSYSDGFGNAAHLITISRPHRYVEIMTSGEIDTLLDDPFARPLAPPRPLTPSERHDYLSPSALVPRFGELTDLAEVNRPATPEVTFEAVQAMMAWIYGGFTYMKDVTTVGTTVPEVLKERSGVCQDFAHVLIGLCRAVDIPARYVSGYIVATSLESDQAPRRGAGASHAWVEAHTPTHGWRGFDPTNNLVASTMHVKMAIGRDYADVPPSRGTFRGQADERLMVDVVSRPLDRSLD